MQQTRSKYGAVPTTTHGIRFHSKREAARYQELLLLAKAGEIEDLELQPRYKLHTASTTGQFFEACKAVAGTRNTLVGEYRADFAYLCYRRGRIVEDVKGVMTPLARWKIKHVEAQYGITVVLVK